MFKFSVNLIVLLFFACPGLLAQGSAYTGLDGINSAYDEHSPMLSPDGKRLYFTRANHPENIGGVPDPGDIWYTEKKDSGWSVAIHAGSVINHPGLNGVVGFSPTGDRTYLLNHFAPNNKGIRKLTNGIAVSHLVNGAWQQPERLKIKYFFNKSSHISATISREEHVLIMAMQSYYTAGNEDLYISFKQADGTWSQPKNLGLPINTASEEWTPYLANDNRTLYFASNGHGGAGSRDIFRTQRINDTWMDWTTPENLGTSVNTGGSERSYSIADQGAMVFFASIQNSDGSGDIIVQKKQSISVVQEDTVLVEKSESELIALSTAPSQPTMVAMTFQVKDSRTREPADAQVVLKHQDKEVTFNTSESGVEKGRFKVTFEEGTVVTVKIEAKGYLKYQNTFSTTATSREGGDDFEGRVKSFFLTRKEVGTKVEIENILFKRGQATFADPALAGKQIDKLIALMEANPGMVIRLEGHTDNRGDAGLLKILSEQRVKAVREYMMVGGISGERIAYVGFGGEKPLTNNDSSEGRETNRRVECVIIK